MKEISNPDLPIVRNSEKLEIPSIIKYMGSKKPIINFITTNIEAIHFEGTPICDLFSGSCSISAALRKKYNFISNDVQEYSSVATTEPIAFADLWADVELDIDDINSWINNPAITSDPFTYKNDLKNSTSHIRNFAKAYLWNSGL